MINAQDTRLYIHFDYSKPVEINNLTASLNAVGRLYTSFVQECGGSDEFSQAKLYIEKIQEGSIDIYLTELVSASVLPFMENVNTIVDFVSYIKSVFDAFIFGSTEKKELTIPECQNFSDVLSLVAGDNKGQLQINAVAKGDNNQILVGCTVNYMNANAGQNQFKNEIENLKMISPNSEIYSQQLMTIYQLRGDMCNDSGNKAIVENISKKKLPVIFKDEELKRLILDSDTNPIKKAFFVDVEVKKIRGKIVAYRVLKLHETIDIQ